MNEYKADLFASRYTTPKERVHSLLYFSEGHTEPPTGVLKKVMTLFSSHPPIDERIERLSKEID
jgi:Zn-dependent protease with chaperone function